MPPAAEARRENRMLIGLAWAATWLTSALVGCEAGRGTCKPWLMHQDAARYCDSQRRTVRLGKRGCMLCMPCSPSSKLTATKTTTPSGSSARCTTLEMV